MKKKIFSTLALCLTLLCSTSCSEEEPLTNTIDFSSEYVIVDDPNDPVQHRVYELYMKYNVPVYFNDTIASKQIGVDNMGNPLVRHETLDLNWKFSSHDRKDISYRFEYLKTSEQKMKSLDFVEHFLENSSAKMRPFCMFVVDTIRATNIASGEELHPSYNHGFRCLTVSQVTEMSEYEIEEFSTKILKDMVLSKVKQNARLISSFGSVSSKNAYYGRPWIVKGSNGGLGCNLEKMHDTNWWITPSLLFDPSVYVIAERAGYNAEQVNQMWKDMASEIGRFGFISGAKIGPKDASPDNENIDLEAYVNMMLTIGAEEFHNRWGLSTLVMTKYEILANYIEGELGIKL